MWHYQMVWPETKSSLRIDTGLILDLEVWGHQRGNKNYLSTDCYTDLAGYQCLNLIKLKYDISLTTLPHTLRVQFWKLVRIAKTAGGKMKIPRVFLSLNTFSFVFALLVWKETTFISFAHWIKLWRWHIKWLLTKASWYFNPLSSRTEYDLLQEPSDEGEAKGNEWGFISFSYPPSPFPTMSLPNSKRQM